jgi:hypothetical protein
MCNIQSCILEFCATKDGRKPGCSAQPGMFILIYSHAFHAGMHIVTIANLKVLLQGSTVGYPQVSNRRPFLARPIGAGPRGK